LRGPFATAELLVLGAAIISMELLKLESSNFLHR